MAWACSLGGWAGAAPVPGTCPHRRGSPGARGPSLSQLPAPLRTEGDTGELPRAGTQSPLQAHWPRLAGAFSWGGLLLPFGPSTAGAANQEGRVNGVPRARNQLCGGSSGGRRGNGVSRGVSHAWKRPQIRELTSRVLPLLASGQQPGVLVLRASVSHLHLGPRQLLLEVLGQSGTPGNQALEASCTPRPQYPEPPFSPSACSTQPPWVGTGDLLVEDAASRTTVSFPKASLPLC